MEAELQQVPIRLGDEVREALEAAGPVVALETSIVTQGMPFPTNLETARDTQEAVRRGGAVPALIGVLGGELVCGLTEDELEHLGTSPEAAKVQKRDLPRIIAQGGDGGVTVGASLFAASLCGIEVFVTGGIGGVAPGAGTSFDISADLQAIASHPCITVCAGTKAFMDVAATLEYLETISVPVAVWRSHRFPWFYSTDSGAEVEWQVNEAEDLARAFRAGRRMGWQGGTLLGVPIPPEDALDEQTTREAVDYALGELERRVIAGKDATPFLLQAVFEHTAGASLVANTALIRHNASIGAKLALALAGC
ncbi:MAG: pseudouridine-5'-phosphate glycosidase [Actinomycetia bacterium]|nr:pseudouridine-5'-phosphate glycosidase [Actinomycetes bacterium]